MKGIRVPIVHLVDNIHKTGGIQERIYKEGIAKIHGNVFPASTIRMRRGNIVLRYCTKRAGRCVKAEYASRFALVDALFFVKDTAKVDIFNESIISATFRTCGSCILSIFSRINNVRFIASYNVLINSKR